MNVSALTTKQNQLLGALPAAEFEILQTDLERTKLTRGDVIYQPGEPIKYVYFPENCIVSMVTTFGDGASIESGIVGREGMTGASVALSNTALAREAYVQMSGHGYRIRTEKFQSALERGSAFKDFVLNYVLAFFEQVTQAGACSNHHPLSKRLARLLLMCYDRTDDEEIRITQDFIAQMLGVYRPSVTTAAIELKEKGLINYNRGSIVIHDRQGLERAACECYQIIKECYSHYFSLLELRSLNRRMERASHAMAAQMQRRREILNETFNRANNLQRAVVSIKSMRGLYSICLICHKIRNERGRWEEIGDFIQNHANINLTQDTCPSCAGKSKLAQKNGIEGTSLNQV